MHDIFPTRVSWTIQAVLHHPKPKQSKYIAIYSVTVTILGEQGKIQDQKKEKTRQSYRDESIQYQAKHTPDKDGKVKD